ncbi:NAD(P)(+) transhydrogenase (Re/Si-specific) subunit beta [Roseisolibacter sp. H3M3-2]|uniref:NAD(P)(+) transhydrogenase (Re/Si-specific) subunit beta n=1 Tax=Roseisolibacter sp. H3M3-2 TaxID=3031323 RepID=UPI0031F2F01B
MLTQAGYVAASVCFMLGLKALTKPETARRGIRLAAVGMLLAVLGTLIVAEIVEYQWILGGLLVGAAIGYPLGTRVPMTAMPQRIAIALTFGASAATMVGVAEYLHRSGAAAGAMPRAQAAALGFEVLLGCITITGSLVAFGKLHEILPGRPLTFGGQNLVNAAAMLGALALLGILVADPAAAWAFWAMAALALVIGASFVLPIGGADMPVVVSLLNSYAGLAACATGFAIGNTVLIIAGALDGASGFILSIIMSKAMNRSFANVLFGAFGGGAAAGGAKSAAGLTVKSLTAEDAAIQLGYAGKVIVVPGYGMAVAQAQHVVRELAELIEKKGGEVKYAIHPVAGRMPGHMNVLLAEANVPYDRMYEMEEINDEFSTADVALVIGANDVVNPAARSDPASPIYGMPILDADRAKSVIVMKRGMSAGFAGIENELFYADNTRMLFGDAKQTLTKLVTEVKSI